MDKNIEDYKAVIINGTNDKSNDVDGNVDFIGAIGECDYHIDCLLSYAVEKYPDVSQKYRFELQNIKSVKEN